MLIKYTHEEFLKILNSKGIQAVHITRKMVYMVNTPKLKYWWPEEVNPIEDKIFTMVVQPIHHWDPDRTEYLTIEECIRKDMKIPAIKIIRMMTGMGLRDAKDFVEVNFYNDPNKRRKQQINHQ